MTKLRKTLLYVFLLCMLLFAEVMIISFLTIYLSAKDTMAVSISYVVLVASLLTTLYYVVKLILAIRDVNKEAAVVTPENKTTEKKQGA